MAKERNAKIVSFFNSKGGAGKTTSTIHIGATLADMGHKVLLIDFDPQASLTSMLNIKNTKYTIRTLLEEDNAQPKLHRRSDNYDILAGDSNLHAITLKPNSFKKAIQSWLPYYDFILLDCRPENISKYLSLPEIALLGSHYFIIPIQASANTVERALESTINQVHEFIAPKHSIIFLGFFFTRVNIRRTRINKRYFNEFKENDVVGHYLFDSYVRDDYNVEDATFAKKTIFQWKPNSNSGQDYIKLTREFLKRIKDEE